MLLDLYHGTGDNLMLSVVIKTTNGVLLRYFFSDHEIFCAWSSLISKSHDFVFLKHFWWVDLASILMFVTYHTLPFIRQLF